ncbi:MAG: hypothetical protein RIE53_00095 [Rhodothermales bacterium]|jgi:hypothetical protein
MPLIRTIKARLAPAAWLLTVLMALAPLGPHASKVVLCFGMDGHVDAEIVHVEDCLDIPIPTGNDAKCSSFKTESGPAQVAVMAVVAHLPAPVHPLPASRVAPPSTYGPTPLHRSVVLLI